MSIGQPLSNSEALRKARRHCQSNTVIFVDPVAFDQNDLDAVLATTEPVRIRAQRTSKHWIYSIPGADADGVRRTCYIAFSERLMVVRAD